MKLPIVLVALVLIASACTAQPGASVPTVLPPTPTAASGSTVPAGVEARLGFNVYGWT